MILLTAEAQRSGLVLRTARRLLTCVAGGHPIEWGDQYVETRHGSGRACVDCAPRCWPRWVAADPTERRAIDAALASAVEQTGAILVDLEPWVPSL